ncbi:MAG: hypothetical protein FJZ92_11660 [Chloroflexi bacterium]|nr:hypothetical protein [Chloroflexota bacterium]
MPRGGRPRRAEPPPVAAATRSPRSGFPSSRGPPESPRIGANDEEPARGRRGAVDRSGGGADRGRLPRAAAELPGVRRPRRRAEPGQPHRARHRDGLHPRGRSRRPARHAPPAPHPARRGAVAARAPPRLDAPLRAPPRGRAARRQRPGVGAAARPARGARGAHGLPREDRTGAAVAPADHRGRPGDARHGRVAHRDPRADPRAGDRRPPRRAAQRARLRRGLRRRRRAARRLRALLNEQPSIEELSRLRAHPRRSLQVMRRMGLTPQAAQEAVLQHHERWTGDGFPEGLSGEALPFRARCGGRQPLRPPHRAAHGQPQAAPPDADRYPRGGPGRLRPEPQSVLVKLLGQHAPGQRRRR